MSVFWGMNNNTTFILFLCLATRQCIFGAVRPLRLFVHLFIWTDLLTISHKWLSNLDETYSLQRISLAPTDDLIGFGGHESRWQHAIMVVDAGASQSMFFLARLFWVDLIKWVSNVRPSVRTSLVGSFFAGRGLEPTRDPSTQTFWIGLMRLPR